MKRLSALLLTTSLLSVACLAPPVFAQSGACDGGAIPAFDADPQSHPFVEAVTLDPGSPGERLRYLRIRPWVDDHIRAHRPLAPCVRLLLPQVAQLRDGALAERDALALQEVLDEGWAQFNLVYTLGGSVSTLAENVAQMGGLGTTNEIMGALGLLMTAWQVTMDLSNNDDEAAALNAYQGVTLYTMGRWGTANIQAASVGVALLNIAIQAYGQAAQAENHSAWRARYTQYYDDLESAAAARTQNRLTGSGRPVLAPTFDEDLARVRGAIAQGYSLHDWTTLLTHYYREARTGRSGFEALMQRAIDDYVALYWASDDPYLSQPGLNEDVRAALNAENRRRVALMLARDVLPEVAALALIMDLRDQLGAENDAARGEQNALLELVVTAYGMDEPVRLTMPHPAGGEWRTRRMLEPGQSLRMRMTRLAWLRAGGPDTLVLPRGDGIEEARFSFDEGDRVVVTFGVADRPAQLRYGVDEGEQSCARATRLPDGTVENETFTRPARGAWVLDTSTGPFGGGADQTGAGTALIGAYSPTGGWSQVAEVAVSAQDGGAVWSGSEPYLDELAEVTCTTDYSPPQTAAEMAAFVGALGTNQVIDCRFTREERSLQDGTETRTRCQSTGQMRVTGLMVPFPDGPRFVAPDAMMPDDATLRGAMELLMQHGGGVAPLPDGGNSQ